MLEKKSFEEEDDELMVFDKYKVTGLYVNKLNTLFPFLPALFTGLYSAGEMDHSRKINLVLKCEDVFV